MKALVTGGAGYFGEILSRRLIEAGQAVSIFDLNPLHTDLPIEQHRGDVRRPADLEIAMRGVDVVYHNVAQVPLARNKELFFQVNLEGTRNALLAARAAGVRRFVYTSSSAVFGIPERNPVNESTAPRPVEDYGRAKLEGERVCRELATPDFVVHVVRPRTILGAGRLGIFSVLFDWVSRGQRLPVLDGGRNVYQFVHAEDLAEVCRLAGEQESPGLFHAGAEHFGTLAETLGALCRHAGTGSRLVSLPRRAVELAMNAACALRLSPLAPYHSAMYGRSLYFDLTHTCAALGWKPRYSNVDMICESYDAFLKARAALIRESGSSPHRALLKQGVLRAVPVVLSLLPVLS